MSDTFQQGSKNTLIMLLERNIRTRKKYTEIVFGKIYIKLRKLNKKKKPPAMLTYHQQMISPRSRNIEKKMVRF